jgi:hypothetical protein
MVGGMSAEYPGSMVAGLRGKVCFLTGFSIDYLVTLVNFYYFDSENGISVF